MFRNCSICFCSIRRRLPTPKGVSAYYTDVYSTFSTIFSPKVLKKNKVQTITILNKNDSLYQSYEVNKKGFVIQMQNPKLTYYIQRNRKQKISRYIRINNENDTTYCTYRYDKNRERLTRLAIVDGEEVSNKTIEKTFSKKGFIQSYTEYYSSDTSNYIVSFDKEKKALNLREIDEFWGETTIYDTKYFYDSKNRVTKFVDYENNKFYGETTYTYNSKGQLVKLTDSYIDDLKDMSGDSGKVDVGDNHYYETTFEYDDNGLLKNIWFKNGETVCEYKVIYN